MRGWFAGIVILLGSIPVFAQATAAIQGHSYLGGTQAQVSGLSSTNYLNGIIPHATITVYLTGTQTLATIYADASNTPLSNPFTSNAVGSSNPGGWIFFAAINQGYDVVASGGIAPNIYPHPITLCADCFAGSQITPPASLTLQHNDTDLADQNLLNFNDTTPAAPSGYANVTFQSDANGDLSGYVAQAGNQNNGECFLGIGGLVGAFTNSAGAIEGSPLCIGAGPATFTVPLNATQLQIGVDDDKFSDNTGSFTVAVGVNGATPTSYTVVGTTMPWSVTTNPAYNYGVNDGTAPVVAATGLGADTNVTISVTDGTVSVGPGFPASGGNGYLTSPPGAPSHGGPTAFSTGSTGKVFPTYYMGTTYTSGAITALTGDVTAIGPGPAAATLATVNTSPGICGDATHVCQITTNGKGLTTSQTAVAISGGSGALTLTTTGTSGAATYSGGTLNIPEYQGALTLTTSGTSGAASLAGNTLNIPQYSGGAPAESAAPGPCDILAAAGTPCIAAHSVTRRMLSTYTGPLFQLQRASDGTTLNVGTLSSGLVNTAAATSFCSGTTCNFSIIYDQMHSPSSGNNLPQSTTADQAPYTLDTFTGGSLPVVAIASGEYYRNRTSTVGMPTGSSAISEYMVIDTAANSTCCGTYGDMESTVADGGNGTMFALAFSTGSGGTTGSGTGPWAGVDWENGVYLYGPTQTSPYIDEFAEYVPSGPSWSLQSGNAVQGALSTLYNGALPSGYTADFQGGLSLGEGGDGSAAPVRFLEGYIAASDTSSATNNAVQENTATFYAHPFAQNQANSPLLCNDISGSATAQYCETTPSFTPANGNCITYATPTTNTGASLTLSVNSASAAAIAVPGASGWTTSLPSGIIPANKPVPMCFDGTNWDAVQTGVSTPTTTAPFISGSGSPTGQAKLVQSYFEPFPGSSEPNPSASFPNSVTSGDVLIGVYLGAGGSITSSGCTDTLNTTYTVVYTTTNTAGSPIKNAFVCEGIATASGSDTVSFTTNLVSNPAVNLLEINAAGMSFDIGAFTYSSSSTLTVAPVLSSDDLVLVCYTNYSSGTTFSLTPSLQLSGSSFGGNPSGACGFGNFLSGTQTFTGAGVANPGSDNLLFAVGFKQTISTTGTNGQFYGDTTVGRWFGPYNGVWPFFASLSASTSAAGGSAYGTN